MVLVDTSAWIFALKKSPFIPLKEKIDLLLREGLVLTFGMIKLELLGGTKSKKEFNRLKNRLDALYEVPADQSLWNKASELAFILHRKGITVPYTDILIASAALCSKATLLHIDIHFDLIVKQTELKAESFISLIQCKEKQGLQKD
ncbi:MAG: PIN domain nuclease [Candidatus Aerophobetes bacterium]|nr:PIN domain nuclease [Candidatus Aerophobetes bacterium]